VRGSDQVTSDEPDVRNQKSEEEQVFGNAINKAFPFALQDDHEIGNGPLGMTARLD
jgi:hypothetical protein